MASFADYTIEYMKKKKKKGEEKSSYSSFSDYTKAVLGDAAVIEEIAPVRDDKDDEIAPAETKEEKRTWFNKGAFEDGYQFGDVVKTAFSTYQDVTNNVEAGILGLGEKAVDTGAYLVGGVAGWLGADKFKDKTADFIAKDLYDEEKLAEYYSIGVAGPFMDAASKLLKIDNEKNSLAGEKTDALAQSAGQLGGTMALQAAGVPWWLTTGATSFGGEVESAFKQGATYGEAGGSAAITAAADILTEKLSGGIKFGGKTLDDVLLKPLTEKIANKTVRTITNLGIDAAGEGFEEVLSGAISNLGTALYKEESIGELLTSEEAIDEYIESFIGGAVLGGGMSGGKAVMSARAGRDYTTGLTDNEQKVVDKVVEDRIKEAEEKGTKIDNKAKSKIIEDVQDDLKKGRIDTDTIESVLGGETFESYKSITEQESALEKELAELGEAPNTVENAKKYEATESKLKELRETSNKEQIKEQLSKEIDSMTGKDTFLRESYNEKARRGQKFEADLTKYDAKQQEVIKKAVDSGILNNTNKTHEFVDLIAKISADKGVSFDFINNQKLKDSGFALEGKSVNGYLKDGNVALNINSAKALNSVVGHEITHVLEGTDLYTELQTVVKEYATTKGEYDSRLQAITKLYDGIDGANIENELTADLIGDYLFTDSDFVNKLSAEKPNIFKKIYEEIKYLYKVATAGSKEAKELEKVKRAFDKAYKNSVSEAEKVRKRYNESEDSNLYTFITKALNKAIPDKYQYKISDSISDKLATDIEQIVGFSVEGYKNKITPGRIRHIYKRHGENGVADNSLSDAHDIARIGYVIDNYDNITVGKEVSEEFKNSDGSPSKTILLQKNIGDEYYYVVEAVPDSKSKTLFVVSAYINKNDTNVEAGNALSPNPDVQDELQSDVSFDNSIPQNQEIATKNEGNAYSLSDDQYSIGAQDVAPVGNYNVYGRDIALEEAPAETTQMPATETKTATQMPLDEYAPLTEEQANERDALQDDRIYSLTENDMPDEVEAPYYDEELAQPEAESPFDDRDIQDVGDRKVKAYMYENPEVKPYFQEEAQNMLYELKNSVKGERIVDANLLYETGGEFGVWGTKRETSEQIAYMLDRFKYTYADIEKGLKAIIEDHGAENNAISKRLEFMIDERLREGYSDFLTGYEIPFNQDYIDLLRDKQINSYTDEAYNQWLETLAREEADPIAETESIDDAAPVMKTEQTEIATENERQLKLNTETGEIEEDIPTKTRKELQKALLEDHSAEIETGLDNAKNIPMILMNNTDTIRVSEMVFGRETGKLINETIFQKAINNEAHSIRWQNKERNELRELGIKAGSKESRAVQMYGEGEYVDENNQRFAYGDAELTAEFSNEATREKIKNAAAAIREKYDSYIELANNTLTSLGFDPIPKRKDYFRHFQELNDAFTRFGLPFNAQNMQEHVLPTDINGLTEFWSPQKNYFANAQPRKGLKTEYDAIKGIDGYISGISNLIYHTEDIQRGRAFEEMIRTRYGEEHGFDNFDNLTPEEQAERSRKIQENHLSNYAAWVHEWTNNIAGKKNKIDRAIESAFGRKAFAFLDETRKQVGANMIGFNLSSSLTNGIASVQAMAKTNPLAVLKGTGDTIKNIFVKDDFMNRNDFLSSRMGTDMLAKKTWEKWRDAGFVFMKGMDWFTSNQIVRSKYYELRSKGLSEENAHAEAGKFAARIMGDRTKGANAQLYNSKLLGLVTQFQLEVNNQLYSMFYDTYHESKEQANNNALRTAAGMTFTLGAMSALTHVYGKTFEALAGYNPTFDIIEIIKTAFGWGEDEDEEKTTSERLKAAADKLVDSLPYVNVLTGGGRIPIASGIPNVVGVITGGKDEYGNELTAKDELKKLLYLVPPTGGNQLKKTVQGLKMFSDEHPIAGSYTDSGNLRFTVEDTLPNRIQAGLFGQWANKNAGEYFDRELAPLKENQIQELVDLDIPISEYWDYREGLKEYDTLEEKFDYIAGLDLPVSKKNIMINNIVDREEDVDLTNYDDFASYEEFDFAIKNPEKHEFLQSNNISYQDYSASEESKEAYNWAYNNPEKYELSKVIAGDVVTYRQYAKELNDIKGEKDGNGNTINGSRKAKVVNYINDLDADYGAKIILFKSEYPADNSYNAEIVEYLNNRDDIDYYEMVDILTGLGFIVGEDGSVRW